MMGVRTNHKAAAILAALMLAACGEQADTLQGYAEAEYLYLAPRESGVIDKLSVAEGDEVSKGAPIFALDTARAEAGLDRAKAARAAGGGSTAARDQAVAEARAAAALAAANLERTHTLYQKDFVSKARFDQDKSAYDAAVARVRAAQAERGAAAQQAQAAGADVDLASEQVQDRAVRAPQAGRIERVFRRPGEFAAAGEPVVALLPAGNIKLRFYAPEARLAQLKLGDVVKVSCDGCKAPIEARITFIASEPQFTPPIIYSLEERAKLVYLVEARPVTAQDLRPGQPVDVGLSS
jgi:HlyD family secretion protein